LVASTVSARTEAAECATGIHWARNCSKEACAIRARCALHVPIEFPTDFPTEEIPRPTRPNGGSKVPRERPRPSQERVYRPTEFAAASPTARGRRPRTACFFVMEPGCAVPPPIPPHSQTPRSGARVEVRGEVTKCSIRVDAAPHRKQTKCPASPYPCGRIGGLGTTT